MECSECKNMEAEIKRLKEWMKYIQYYYYDAPYWVEEALAGKPVPKY